MSRTTKSNLDHKTLAWKKALYQEFVCFLGTNFTSAYGDPPKKLHCEELFQDENEVPEEYISGFIADQNKLIHRLEDDLALYALEKRKQHDEEQPEESAKTSPKGKTDAGKPRHHQQGEAGKRARAAQRQPGKDS